MITAIGKECFESNAEYDYLREPNIPFCFLFVFNSFLEIYNFSGETITWTTIYSYAKLRRIEFKQIEINYILKCSNWANAQIKKMRDECNYSEEN